MVVDWNELEETVNKRLNYAFDGDLKAALVNCTKSTNAILFALLEEITELRNQLANNQDYED